MIIKDKGFGGARLGFIGVGNMGGALVRAARKNTPSTAIWIANRSPEKAGALAAEISCQVKSNAETAAWADYLFLGVKPQAMGDLLAELAPILAEREDRFVLVSMAAGLAIGDIQAMAGGDYPVLRIMPNTPCSIGEGMILYTSGPGVRPDEERAFLEAMAGAGRFSPIPEKLMDAGSAVAGCGPAFVDLFLEALADGGLRRAPGPGPGVCRPDGAGLRPAGPGERKAPRGAEGRGVLPRRVHHPGRAEAGRGGLPGGRDGRSDRRL